MAAQEYSFWWEGEWATYRELPNGKTEYMAPSGWTSAIPKCVEWHQKARFYDALIGPDQTDVVLDLPYFRLDWFNVQEGHMRDYHWKLVRDSSLGFPMVKAGLPIVSAYGQVWIGKKAPEDWMPMLMDFAKEK